MSLSERLSSSLAKAAAGPERRERLFAYFATSREFVALAVAAITLVIHSRALWNGFVDWDDQINFLTNEHYRGLGWAQLRWMTTTVLMGQWIPFTWLTLGADYAMWGMRPFGYHLTNIVLHAGGAALFFLVAERILRAAVPAVPARSLRLGAGAAALFFAIHPLRAESVAWITERRDVLSGLLFFASVFGYLVAQDQATMRRRSWLALSVGAYAFACLSKSIVVTLPLLLLLLDVYPLRRLPPRLTMWTGGEVRRLTLEKIPYVLIAAGTAIMAVYAQIANRFLTSFDALPLISRITVMLYGVWFYVSTTVLPIGLSPLYELPARVHPFEGRYAWAALGVAALTAAFLLLRSRWPAGLAAWTAYLVTLAPVSGIVHNGHQLAHDRYSYLACLPWALLFGSGLVALVTARRHALVRPALARIGVCVTLLWLVGLGGMTWHQVAIWRDSDTLWRYALDADADCSICQSNLGVSLFNRRMPAEAIERFERSIALRPDRVRTEGNLGVALMATGRAADAIPRFQRVLATYPADVDVRVNLAVALLQSRRDDDGVAQLREVLGRDPKNILALTNLATALLNQGDAGAALSHLERAVQIKPDLPAVRAALVRTHLALGHQESTREHLEILRGLDPRAASALDPLLLTTW